MWIEGLRDRMLKVQRSLWAVSTFLSMGLNCQGFSPWRQPFVIFHQKRAKIPVVYLIKVTLALKNKSLKLLSAWFQEFGEYPAQNKSVYSTLNGVL